MVSVSLAFGQPLDEAAAWTLLRGLAERSRAEGSLTDPCGLRLGPGGELELVASDLGSIWVDPSAEPCFGARAPLAPGVSSLLSLYLPLCVGPHAGSLVIAHVGQSLDGQIATATGASRYVTGHDNLVHLHRLRALTDAVIVGASTVECDDPQLTTRLAIGENPARVVIDPHLRVSKTRRVFTDESAPTWVVCAKGSAPTGALPSNVRVIELPERDGRLPPRAIVAELARRGLRRLFVEGGGVTVSRFLSARVANRLHVAISPIILGSGRPGLALPPIDRIDEALRPKTRRFELGEDVLFDCILEREGAA
jgi:diaminohydroxyphosphoribosylaminopyrimidine deaminase/5-amino-6-(5-phosphoribosylamino)uracil reductase